MVCVAKWICKALFCLFFF